MTCKNANWQKLLKPDCIITSDVSLYVVEEEGTGNSEAQAKKFFKSHRLILATVSPVFKRQFYGPMKDTKEMIEVKETTEEALETLLNLIYKKEVNLKSKSFYALFEILNLAERYQMPEIVHIITDQIKTVELNMENVMEAAAVAENYSRFEQASKALFERCGLVIDKQLKTMSDIIKFLSDDTDDKIDTLLLKRILVAIGRSTCSNCKHSLAECLDGKDVTPQNIIIDAKVYGRQGGSAGYQTAFTKEAPVTILRKHLPQNHQSAIYFIKPSNGIEQQAYVIFGGQPQFVFKCK